MAEKSGRQTRAAKTEVEAEKKITSESVSQAVLGMLPAPDELAKYEKVIPGGAERILEMAEGQVRCQQEVERRMLDASVRTERIFQAITFILALVAGGLGGALLLGGSELAGLIIILIDAAALVGTTVYGQRRDE